MKDDVLFIKQLVVDVVIGVFPHERNQNQKVIFDLEFTVDTRKAAATDDLAHTVDYHRLAHLLNDYVSTTQFQLIETLAEKAAALLIQEFNLAWLKLTLTKPAAVAVANAVGVTIERP